MKLTEVSAQILLLKCTGDAIWDRDACHREGVPQQWIDELCDCFESGYDTDRNTIYFQEKQVNQYEGILDLHLAYRLAEFLNIDWRAATATALSRRAEVQAIQAELDEI